MPFTAQQIIEMSFKEDLMNREEERQNNAFDRIAMLNDDFETQVWNKMKLLISKESQEKMQYYVNASLNVFGEVIGQHSEIYLDDPTREFKTGEKKKDVKKVDLLNSIYDDAKINQVMERVNEYMNAVNDVLIMPVWRNERIELDILTPNTFSVIENEQDSTKADVVMIKHEVDGNPENKYWVVWTDEEHYIIDKDKNIIAIEGNEEMKNPYGKMPFVFVHRKKSDGSFWDGNSREDLYQCTIVANIRQSFADFYAVWNSFKQIAVATGDELPSGLIVSPDKVFKMPEGAEAQVLNFQGDFKQFTEALEDYVVKVLNRYGVSGNSFKAIFKEESGRALKIRNSVLERFRKKQIKVLRDAEQDLFELIKLIYSTHKSDKFDNVELFIDYAAMDQHVDEKEQLEIIGMELNMNLRDKVEVFMERNPDYTDYEEAKKKLTEIIKSNNELNELVDFQVNSELNKPEPEGEE